MKNDNHSMHADVNVDAKQMRCPMPLLKLKQALNSIAVGDTVHLVATDKTSLKDINAFVQLTSHTVQVFQENSEIHFYVCKS